MHQVSHPSGLVQVRARDFYADVLETLHDAGIPALVGGAFALRDYSGIARDTKDLDLFLRPSSVDDALEVLSARGYATERLFPHWLSKVYSGDYFVDLIHDSANGICPVDDAWFSNAVDATTFDLPTRLCPIEEMILTKCYVMERERFDGADICHLIVARGDTLDWRRLLARFGANWRVLYGHLVFYSFVFPRERHKVPTWVMDELARRVRKHGGDEEVDVCRGTLLSREQYLADLRERNYEDARLAPWGTVPPEDIYKWTDAIGKIK